jgi:hypothetical protein
MNLVLGSATLYEGIGGSNLGQGGPQSRKEAGEVPGLT